LAAKLGLAGLDAFWFLFLGNKMLIFRQLLDKEQIRHFGLDIGTWIALSFLLCGCGKQ
jgi:hypothetical protein